MKRNNFSLSVFLSSEAKRKILGISFLIAILFAKELNGQVVPKKASDDRILQEFIKSKGNDIIVFGASNIKHFWIDKSVVAKGDHFEIINQPEDKHFISIPLKIQLDNVIETLDCHIEVITETANTSFTIFNNKSKKIGYSSPKDDFIHYKVTEGMFHLEETEDFSFILQFTSETEYMSIKNIVLSFTSNPKSDYLGSPGFRILLSTFEKDGVTVPNTEVQYLLDEKYNKLYLKIPHKFVEYRFVYHIYPEDQKDLVQGNTKFNNLDFDFNDKGAIIPMPYSGNKEYIIFQRQLPTYEYSRFIIGQFDRKDPNYKTYWSVEIKKQQ